jgi:hypothetical protein
MTMFDVRVRFTRISRRDASTVVPSLPCNSNDRLSVNDAEASPCDTYRWRQQTSIGQSGADECCCDVIGEFRASVVGSNRMRKTNERHTSTFNQPVFMREETTTDAY